MITLIKQKVAGVFRNLLVVERSREQSAIIGLPERALLRDLVTVVDAFDMSNAILTREKTATEHGFLLIGTLLLEILASHGLQEVGACIGDVFNPNIHHAVAAVPSASEHNTIAKITRRGFTYQNILIRPVWVDVFMKTTSNLEKEKV